jgi:hypothetical protein
MQATGACVVQIAVACASRFLCECARVRSGMEELREANESQNRVRAACLRLFQILWPDSACSTRCLACFPFLFLPFYFLFLFTRLFLFRLGARCFASLSHWFL